MGECIDFASLSWVERSTGVGWATLVDEAGLGSQDMVAGLVRLSRGSRTEADAPAGSDRYLFTLEGRARLVGPDGHHDLGPGVFASLREGQQYTLIGPEEGDALVLSVMAPPPGARRPLPGTRETVVVRASELPVVEEADSGKRRIYLVTEEMTGSKRAHGMIVVYGGTTVTPPHYHPDAESLFVFLEGTGVVVVNGREVTARSGRAAYFGRGDPHALWSADPAGMRFLEFHIPGTYGVVRV
jgi:mannose-6-phosphate isomerase-like protein (cupin superfamily)